LTLFQLKPRERLHNAAVCNELKLALHVVCFGQLVSFVV
jgi:hypothetical protein